MLLLLPVHWAGHKPVTFDPGKVLWLVERGQWQRFPLANPMWLICPPQLAAEQISATASPDEWKQFAKRWERHFNLLEASLLSEHKCVIAFLISNVFFIWTMSYFGLHPVSPCDELSVTSSFLGQPVDKSRAGPFPNPKRETPTIQWISFRHSALEHDETHSWNYVDVCCFVFLWFHLWEPEFFFTRLITSLVFPTSPSVKTNTCGKVYISL